MVVLTWNRTFLEVVSMVVTWWIVAFLPSVCLGFCQPVQQEVVYKKSKYKICKGNNGTASGVYLLCTCDFVIDRQMES